MSAVTAPRRRIDEGLGLRAKHTADVICFACGKPVPFNAKRLGRDPQSGERVAYCRSCARALFGAG